MISEQLIEKHIRFLVEKELLFVTPSDLIRKLQSDLPGSTHRQIRFVIGQMVRAGVLAYDQHNGTTHLKSDRHGFLRISARISLYRGRETAAPLDGRKVVRLMPGVSFGAGDHPTTRLSLRGLDAILLRISQTRCLEAISLLDMGTGNGVLAIAAAMLGIGRVVAIDTDPLACHEALANATANGVSERIKISSEPLNTSSAGRFGVVIANLRPPTLAQFFDVFRELSLPGSIWILSGFRSEERKTLENRLPGHGKRVWSAVDRNWGAAAYQLCSRGCDETKLGVL